MTNMATILGLELKGLVFMAILVALFLVYIATLVKRDTALRRWDESTRRTADALRRIRD